METIILNVVSLSFLTLAAMAGVVTFIFRSF